MQSPFVAGIRPFIFRSSPLHHRPPSHRIALGWAVFLLASSPQWAAALELGKLEVLSALGEPLRAEVAVPELTPLEAASLQLSISEPGPFQTPGVSYPSLDHGIQIELMRRQGGEPYLSLKSNQEIKEPLIGIVLDLKWRSGRLVRDYLMLLRTPESAPVTVANKALVGNPPTPALPTPPPTARNTLQTQSGDTAGELAKKIKPSAASLEQALLALVQENPSAFIDGNANRMRAGVILDVPDPAQILATPPAQARQWLLEQSEAFDAYRSVVAQHALKQAPQNGLQLELQAPGQRAAGKIQAPPPEAPPDEEANDKLTLSQAQKNAQEAQLAQEKQAQAQADRLAELKKNIGDLNQLKSDPAAPPSTPAAVGASLPTAQQTPTARTHWPQSGWLWGAAAALALILGAGAWWAIVRAHRRRSENVDPDEPQAADPFSASDPALQHGGFSTDDPLMRADQLIAMGQLDAAEDHLKTALRNNPALLTAQAKLLEVYALRTHSSGLAGLQGLSLDLPLASEGPIVADFSDDDFELDTSTPTVSTRPLPEMPPISLDLNDS